MQGSGKLKKRRKRRKKTQETILLFIDREQFCLPLSDFEHALKHAERVRDEAAGRRGRKEGQKRTGGAEEVFEKSVEGVEM